MPFIYNLTNIHPTQPGSARTDKEGVQQSKTQTQQSGKENQTQHGKRLIEIEENEHEERRERPQKQAKHQQYGRREAEKRTSESSTSQKSAPQNRTSEEKQRENANQKGKMTALNEQAQTGGSAVVTNPRPKIASRQPTLYAFAGIQGQVTPTEEVKTDIIKIATININQGLKTKLPEILAYVKRNEISILAIIDHGLREEDIKYLEIDNDQFIIHWATVKRDADKRTMNTAGVAILTTPEMDSKRIGMPKTNKARAITIRYLTQPGRTITITALYCPAWSSQEAIKWLQENTPNTQEERIILGDFNLTIDERLDSWRTGSPSSSHEAENREVQKILVERNLTDAYRHCNGKKARGYTYCRHTEAGISKRRIDHVWVSNNLSETLVSCQINNIHAIGDHSAVEISIAGFEPLQHIELPKPVQYTKPKIPQADHDSWKTYLENLNTKIKAHENDIEELLEREMSNMAAEDMLRLLTEILTETQQETWKQHTAGPRKTDETPTTMAKRIKRKHIQKARGVLTMWHTQLTNAAAKTIPLQKVEKRLKLLRKYNLHLDEDNLHEADKVHELTIKLNKALKEATKDYRHDHHKDETKNIEDRIKAFAEKRRINPNEIYRVTSKKGKSTPITRVIETTSEGKEKLSTTVEGCKKAIENEWGKWWKSKGYTSSETPRWMETPPANKEQIQQDQEAIATITMTELEEAIEKASIGKAAGPDGIYNETLKRLPPPLKELLLRVMQIAWDTKQIPHIWSKSRIHLLHKGGTKYRANNYRPIALLSCTYKLYSTIIEKRLRTTCEKYQILSELQYGFRKGRTTTDCITILQQIIQDANTKDKQLILELIDLAKAFDSVEHWALIETLEFYGIPTELIQTIDSLLRAGIADIITGVGLTDEINITCGVRQGDGLSPLLFILFINPLLRHLETLGTGYKASEVEEIPGRAFADDLILSSDTTAHANQAHQLLCDFCAYNNIDINVQKSAIIQTKEEPIQLVWKGKAIPILKTEEHYKYLGVHINAKNEGKKAWEEAKEKFVRIVSYICRKKVEIVYRILLINRVAHAGIGYVMQHLDVPEEELQMLDAEVTKNLKMSLRTRQSTDDEIWYADRKLIPLEDLYIALRAATILRHVLNAETQAGRIYKLNKGTPAETPRLELINNRLTNKGLQIVDTHSKYIPLGSIWEQSSEPVPGTLQLRSLREVCIEADNPEELKLPPYEDLVTKYPFTLNSYDALWRKTMNIDTMTVHPSWLLPTLTPFTHMKGTLKLDPRAHEHAVWGDKWLAWTDGSVHTDIAVSAAWFGACHSKNIAFQTWGEQTVNNAELQAIEYVLTIAPETQDMLIVSDSQYSTWICNKTLSAHELEKLSNNITIKRIQSLIRQRRQIGSSTEFIKVYSHISDKLKSPDMSLVARVTLAQEQLLNKYGVLKAQALREGNEKADKLAAREIQARIVAPWLSGGARYQVATTGKVSIQMTGNVLRGIKQTLLRARIEKWEGKRGRRTRYRRNKEYDTTLTTKILNSLDPRDGPCADYIHKVLQGALNLRHAEADIASNMTDEHPYARYMKSAYDDNFCAACKQKGLRATEDYFHYTHCQALEEQRRALWKEIQKMITEAGGSLMYVYPWFCTNEGTDFYVPEEKETKHLRRLNEFNTIDGTLGYIPAALTPALTEMGVPTENSRELATKIAEKIQRTAHLIWRERCNTHSKQEELGKKKRATRKKRKTPEKEAAKVVQTNKITQYLIPLQHQRRTTEEEAGAPSPPGERAHTSDSPTQPPPSPPLPPQQPRKRRASTPNAQRVQKRRQTEEPVRSNRSREAAVCTVSTEREKRTTPPPPSARPWKRLRQYTEARAEPSLREANSVLGKRQDEREQDERQPKRAQSMLRDERSQLAKFTIILPPLPPEASFPPEPTEPPEPPEPPDAPPSTLTPPPI